MGSENKWELKQFGAGKYDCAKFRVASVIIGVEMKYEKGLSEGDELRFQPKIPLKIKLVIRIITNNNNRISLLLHTSTLKDKIG